MSDPVRIVLANDTRADANPGCQATVSALVRLLEETTDGAIQTLPMGAGYEVFGPLVEANEQFDGAAWRRAVDVLQDHAPVASALRAAGRLVVNLEGTFHHHTVGALALGGLMAIAHRMNVPVWAVNGTVQGIEPWLIEETLHKAEYVAVREPTSARWLEQQGVRATVSADCAFDADVFAPWHGVRIPPGAALFTAGVFGRRDQVERVEPGDVTTFLEHLASGGLRPVFFEMETDEAHLTAAVEARGWMVVRNADVPWAAFGSFLRQFDLVASGRYHVLVFAAMAGVPIVALRSNTWKVEGLLQHLGLPQVPAGRDRIIHSSPVPRLAAAEHVDRCRRLARRNVPILSLARLRDDALVDALFAAAAEGDTPRPIVIETAPGAGPWAQVVRPMSTWRRMFDAAGLEIADEYPVAARAEEGAGGTPRQRWRRLRPFRDEADGGRRVVVVRARRPDASHARHTAARELRRLMGLPPPVRTPAVLLRVDTHVVFLVGTYQEFRQYLPLWAHLPATAYSVVVRQTGRCDAGTIDREAAVVAWLRARGVDATVVRSTDDVPWHKWPQPHRVLIAGADSTAYDGHFWNAAIVAAAAARGCATRQIQHGIWPYADLQRPMTLLSDVVLTWSGEFERNLNETVDWPDGTAAPRGAIDGVSFETTGCPLFDAYARENRRTLSELVGDWVCGFDTVVLVATNLHWSRHTTGERVNPSVIDLARRMPRTLFVLKLHPVHDADEGLLGDVPSNVLVLDEFCCLAADLDSPSLVSVVDAVVATQSTVVLEAGLAGKPCIVLDTGNANRYRHVDLVDPADLDDALRAALAAPADVRPFVAHYFDVDRLGTGTRDVLDAIARAAGTSPCVSQSRASVAIERFATRLSSALFELEEAKARLAATWAEAEALRCAADATARELVAQRVAAAAGARVMRAVERRDLALLGPRPDRRTRVVLYGASGAGRVSLAAARCVPHLNVVAFVDSDPARVGATVDGVPVVAPEAATPARADVIVIASMQVEAVAARLAELGFSDRIVFDRTVLETLARQNGQDGGLRLQPLALHAAYSGESSAATTCAGVTE